MANYGFTIYTFGDSEIITNAMNAVAMLFNGSGSSLWTNNGGLGLGHAAGFGLLVTLAFIFINTVLKQKLEIEHFIITAVAYVIMFIPTTSLNVEDMTTGQVNVVDNVPIGIAMPGAVMSALTNSMTKQIGTVMRMPMDTSPSGSISGMVQPLKLLLALRGGAYRDSDFAASVNTYYKDCGGGVTPPLVFAQISPADRINLVGGTTYASNHITLNYDGVNPQGVLVPCTDQASALTTRLSNLLYQTDPNIQSNTAALSTADAHINSNLSAPKPITGVTSGFSPYNMSDIESALTLLSGASIDAQKMSASIFMSDLERDTYNCNMKLTDPGYAQCVGAMSTAMEQWKMDAAGQASMFQKTMIPSMNVFMFFFYAFAPIIAIIVTMSGMRGVVQILPKYMLFGVWTQTWIPAVVIINYFIEMQAYYAIQHLTMGNASGVALSSLPALYSVLSIKVAAASDLLASVPILTLSLLSGSVFALAQMAKGGKDYFDEKNAAPGLQQTGAVTTKAPMLADSRGSMVGDVSGVHGAGAMNPFSMSVDSGSMKQFAHEMQGQFQQAEQRVDEASGTASHRLGVAQAGNHSLGHDSRTQSAIEQNHGRMFEFAKQLQQGNAWEGSTSSFSSLGIDGGKLAGVAMEAFALGAKNGLAGKKLQDFVTNSANNFISESAKLGQAVGMKQVEQVQISAGKAIAETFSSNAKSVDGWAATFQTSEAGSEARQFTDNASEGWDKNSAEKLAHATSESKQYGDAYKVADTASKAITGSEQIDAKRFGQAVAGGRNTGLLNWARNEAKSQGISGEQLQEAMRDNDRKGLFTGPGQGAEREFAGLARLLKDTDSANALAANTLAAEKNQTPIGSPSTPQSAGATQAQVNKGLKDAKDGTGLTPDQIKRINAAANGGRKDAAKAEQKAAVVPGQIESDKKEAVKKPTKSDFDNNSRNVDKQADASGKRDANDQRALHSTPSDAFTKGMNAAMSKFKDDHGFVSLVKDLMHDIGNDPVLAGVAALAGAGAAANLLHDIYKGYKGGKGGGISQYTGTPIGGGGKGGFSSFAKKVLDKMAKKMPSLAAGAAARHVVASEAGAVGAVAGPAVAATETIANGAALVFDGVALGGALVDAIGQTRAEMQAEKKSPLNLSVGESQILDGVSSKSGVPREYLEHALQLENSGEHAVSPKGAKGRFQIMGDNLRKGEDPTNFGDGANAAARVLHDAISRYGHDERAVMAYYNGGAKQGDLVHSGAAAANKETRDYVARLDKIKGSSRA